MEMGSRDRDNSAVNSTTAESRKESHRILPGRRAVAMNAHLRPVSGRFKQDMTRVRTTGHADASEIESFRAHPAWSTGLLQAGQVGVSPKDWTAQRPCIAFPLMRRRRSPTSYCPAEPLSRPQLLDPASVLQSGGKMRVTRAPVD